MEGIMGDELFMSTQLQGEDQNLNENGSEGDDVYISLAKAITERKCRIDQKKEKLRLIIDEKKKRKQELTSAAKEVNRLKEELEEVNIQNNTQVQNIKNLQESLATLETTLCDLNNTVSLKKAEIKRKKDEYDALILDSIETWESYKEMYENFPLARKRRSLVTEKKKLEIELNQILAENAKLKMKKELMNSITEKIFHLRAVKLAESYFIIQKKNEEKEKLQCKIRELKVLIADIKSGKKTNQQVKSFSNTSSSGPSKEIPMVRSPADTLLFIMPELPVNSPPTSSVNEDVSSGGFKVFDWRNLISSTSLLSFPKKQTEKSLKSIENTSNKQALTYDITSKTQLESTKGKNIKTPYDSMKTTSSLKLTHLLKNISPMQKKRAVDVVKKRYNETNIEVNKEQQIKAKKVYNVQTQPNTQSSGAEFAQRNNLVMKDQDVSSVIKATANENVLIKDHKENVDPKTNNSPSMAKLIMSSLTRNNENRPIMTTNNSKTMNQSLSHILSMKQTLTQRKVSDAKKHVNVVVQDSAKLLPVSSANYQNLQQYDQQNNNKEKDVLQNYVGNQNQQLEDAQISEPSSPAPDLIPVGNNSQPLSEGNMQQMFSLSGNYNLSGGSSDFLSPSDLDEASKLVYQQIASEAQNDFDYPRGNQMSHQKSVTEGNVVRSQYFSDQQFPVSPTLDNASVDYQYPPYSPPDNPQLMSSSPAPPSGSIGNPQTANKPNEGFSFTFGDAPKNKSSIFSLF